MDSWSIFDEVGDDLYVQSNTLLLADVFENFEDMCIKVCRLDSAYFLSEPGLTWQTCLKKQDLKEGF